MSFWKISFWLSALIFCLSSCSFSLGSSGDGRAFYVVKELPFQGSVSGHSEKRLRIRYSKANRFIDSHRILFSDDPARLSYYQFASWVDRPPEYLSNLLAAKLEKAKLFDSVSQYESAASDLLLNTEILELYHDTREKPGQVRIRVSAELLDLTSDSQVAQQTFEKALSVESYDAVGAVRAFEKGLNEIVDEIIIWLSHQLPTSEKS